MAFPALYTTPAGVTARLSRTESRLLRLMVGMSDQWINAHYLAEEVFRGWYGGDRQAALRALRVVVSRTRKKCERIGWRIVSYPGCGQRHAGMAYRLEPSTYVLFNDVGHAEGM